MGLLAAPLLSLAAACTSGRVVWSHNYDFPRGWWVEENRVTLTPDSGSVAGKKISEAVLTLRYLSEASAETLPVIVEQEWLDQGMALADTLNIKLLPDSLRSGTNSTLGLFEISLPLPTHLPVTPGWSVTLRPTTDVSGLTSITLTLKE